MKRTLAAVASTALVSLYAPSSFGQNLEPPPPMAPGTPQSPSALPSGPPQESDEESKDSGLGLEWVWLNADVGFAFANMNSFSASQLALTQTSGSGPAFGVGAGVRLASEQERQRQAGEDAGGRYWRLPHRELISYRRL